MVVATLTLPLANGEAKQQWMCAPVAPDVNPVYVIFTAMVLAVVSRVTSARPVPVEVSAGLFSAAAFNVALNSISAA